MRKRGDKSAEYVCGRGRKTMGGLEGVESVALPRGSVCKPLSTPQSCFHKEIYKTGLRCALLPCITSVWVFVWTCVCVADISFFNTYFFLISSMQKNVFTQVYQTRQVRVRTAPVERRQQPIPPWWLCAYVCARVYECVCPRSCVNVFQIHTYTGCC